MTPGLAFFYLRGLVTQELARHLCSLRLHGLTTVICSPGRGRFRSASPACRRGLVNLDMAFLHCVTLARPRPRPASALRVSIAYHEFSPHHPPRRSSRPPSSTGVPSRPMAFCPVLLVVYFPFVQHDLGRAVRASCSAGRLDFAGGIRRAQHAGMAALASLYVGRRRVIDCRPHTCRWWHRPGLLWFGWYGFPRRREFPVDSVTCRPPSSHYFGGPPSRGDLAGVRCGGEAADLRRPG